MCNYSQIFDLFSGAGIVVEYRDPLVTTSHWCFEQVLNTAVCDKCQTLQRTQKATTTLDWQVKFDKMGRIQKVAVITYVFPIY